MVQDSKCTEKTSGARTWIIRLSCTAIALTLSIRALISIGRVDIDNMTWVFNFICSNCPVQSESQSSENTPKKEESPKRDELQIVNCREGPKANDATYSEGGNPKDRSKIRNYAKASDWKQECESESLHQEIRVSTANKDVLENGR